MPQYTKKKPLSVNINNNISKAMPMFMCKSYVNESYSDLPNVVFNYRIREKLNIAIMDLKCIPIPRWIKQTFYHSVSLGILHVL